MKDIVNFINEAQKSEPTINFDEFKDEIDKLNQETKFSFGVYSDEGEHLYIREQNSKKWYTPVSDKFKISHWDFDDIVKYAPKLAETLYIPVKTYETPDNRSRINGLMRHYVRPVLTHQGMFCNSEKECKQFIKAVKNELRPDNGEVKKYKLTPMTIKEYTEFIKAETNRGEFYHYEHSDAQFIKYEM